MTCIRDTIHEVQKSLEWFKWGEELPYLDFDNNWLVKAIPPFGTGIVRYNIKHKKIKNSWVSIYFDAYNMSGYYGGDEPYWEVYPYEGDVFRCGMHDTDDLIEAIKKSFEEQEEE